MHRYLDRLYKDVLPLFTSTGLTSVSSMYIIIRASLVLNICSSDCLVSSLSPMVFYFQCFPLAGLRLRFFWYVFPQDRRLLGCFFGRWFLIIPCFFFFCSDLAARSGCSFSLQVCSLLATHLPLRQVFFWPAILTPRYPFFRYPSPAPPRLFLTGYFDAQVSFFRYPSPAPPRLFWPAILTPRYPFSGTLFFRHGLITALSFWCPWSSFSTPSISQPTIPYRLFGWPDRSLCRLAVHLCFYRSALGRLFGGSAIPPPFCLLPPNLRPLPGAASGACSSVASPVGRHSWPSFVPPGWPLSGS